HTEEAGMLSHAATRALIAATALGATACAYTPGVSPDLNQETLARTNKAVAIVQMGIEGEGCMVTTIGIGQRKEAGFEAVETLRFFPVPGSAGDAAQVELAPGEYHIVSWNCSRPKGTPSITLGGYQGGNVLGQGGQYTESYGSFTLAAGEIVNLG